jgi:hypothetical protein
MTQNKIDSFLNSKKNFKYFEFLASTPFFGKQILTKDCLGEKIIHCHHIIPKYWFNDNPKYLNYMNSDANLIFLTQDNHIKAHEILYDIFGDPRDLGAVALLKGITFEASIEYKRAGAYATHLVLKKAKKNLWSSEKQKRNAAKSMARNDAYLIRSLGGKQGGYNRNINRVITKNSKVLFCFEGIPFLCVFNCQTGGDVLKELQKAKKTNLTRVSPLLTKKRKTLYGWSCSSIDKDLP